MTEKRDSGSIEIEVKELIMAEFLPGEDPNELTLTTPLISGGILDSIATLRLAEFLEQRYGFQLEAHEVDEDHLDTIEAVTRLVLSKS
jgi:acyl carrier protein